MAWRPAAASSAAPIAPPSRARRACATAHEVATPARPACLVLLEGRRAEGIAGVEVSRFQPLPEPALPLRGGSVREGIRCHPAAPLALPGVVADRAGGSQRLFHIPGFPAMHFLVLPLGPT